MRTQTNTNQMQLASIDILMQNSTIQVLKHAYFKCEVPAPEEFKAWYENKHTRKAISSMIAIALNTAKREKELLIN